MKKFISSIIALAMVVSMLPMTMASAAEPTEVAYWETMVANMELENAAGGKTFVASNDKKELVENKNATDGKVAFSATYADMALYQQTHLVFGKIDLGKVDDIKGIGLYRVLHDITLPAVTFYGSNEDLTARADLETKATLLGTIAEDTTTVKQAPNPGHSTGAFAVADGTKFRYIYMTTPSGACGLHINEVYVYSEIEDTMDELATGLTGIDNNGAAVTRYTDNSNTNTGTPLNGWVKYDLGELCELKALSYSSNSPQTSNYWWQNGIYIKANTEDNMDTATTVMGTNNCGVSQGRKIPLNGTYRYIWLCADSGMHLSKFRVYGYPTTARTVQVDPRNYTNALKWYSDAALTQELTMVDDASWTIPSGLINYKQGFFTDGKVSNDGILAISAYAETEAPTLELKVPRITADGWYDVSYFAGGRSPGLEYVSPIKITMKKGADGEIIPVSEFIPGARNQKHENAAVKTGFNYGVWAVSGEKVYLEKGSDYTMYIKLYKAFSSTNMKAINTNLSRITLTPSTIQEVAADTATVLEYEDYVSYSKNAIEGASGDAIIAEKTGAMGSATANINPFTITMPVNVKQAGNYKLSAILGTKAVAEGAGCPTTKVYVNGVEKISNAAQGADSGIAPFKDELNFELDKYTSEVYLNEGLNIISTQVSYRGQYTNETQTRFTGYAADCITLELDNRAAMTAEFTNLADGAQNVTNIANLAEHVYDQGQYDNLTTITEPIWVQFSDNVDMQTVSASTVKVNKGTSAVSYTPVIDTENKRLGVDIADLDPNTTYTIEVTEGVKSTEDVAVTPATLTFETHVPAKIRYKEGTTIQNIAYGAKTKIVGDNSKSPTPSITDIYRWTNGVMGAEAVDTMALNTAGDPAPYAIIDLGDTYTILGQATVSGPSNWQSRFFQMNVLQSEDEALSDSNLLEKVGNTYSTGYCQSTLENAKGRYIAIKSLGQDAQDDGNGHLKLQEILILTQTVPNPVSQDKTTRIEIEDYADAFAAAFGETSYQTGLGTYANPTQPVGMVKYTGPSIVYSGVGMNAMYGSKSTTEPKTFSIPVTITEEGYYNATYRIGGAVGITGFAYLDAALVAEDGTEYSLSNAMLRDHNADSEEHDQNRVNDGNARHIWTITSSAVKVLEGSYDLKFTINGSTLTFDYVDIKPFAVAEVGTPIETDSMLLSTDAYEGIASNDTIQAITWGYYDKAQTSYTYPVKIAEAGEYAIETVMSYAKSTLLSGITVLVDGKEVYKNNVTAKDVSLPNEAGEPQFVSKDFPMNKYSKVVALDEGVHEITYVMTKTTDSAYKFAIDYTLVAPYIENPISQSGSTRIEAEDYADEFAAAFGQTTYDTPAAAYALPTDSLVAKYIPTTTVVSGNAAMWAKALEEDTVMEIPVTVTEAGTYKAKLRIGASGVNSGQVASAGIIFVDKDGNEYKMGDTMFPDLQYAGGYPDGAKKNLLEPQVYASGAGIFSGYTGTAYVPAGEYTAKIVIPAGKYSFTTISEVVNEETKEKETVETVNNINKPFVLDYIEFMAAAPVVKAGEVAEAEDYFNVGEAEKAGFASGDKYSYTSWAYSNAKTIEYTIPVEVEEAGYYDVEAAMHYATGGNTTNIVISVGGTAVYNNTKPGEDISDTDGDGTADYRDHWFPMNKYTGNKVKLEAGINNIVFTMKRANDNAYKHAIDYVKVTKSQDEMFIDGNEVVIKANYGKTVSGDAYMAFYKGDKLVEVKEAGSVGTSVVEVGAVPPTDEYDYVKLLVWGTNLMPSVYAIGFNN